MKYVIDKFMFKEISYLNLKLIAWRVSRGDINIIVFIELKKTALSVDINGLCGYITFASSRGGPGLADSWYVGYDGCGSMGNDLIWAYTSISGSHRVYDVEVVVSV